MPKVTLYIRNEDTPLWNLVQNKPAWIHAMLQRTQHEATQAGGDLHTPKGSSSPDAASQDPTYLPGDYDNMY